ncbi:uncharacterized protein [Fopius arisanus]|uniref:RNase H type-1 domain-containing protein n=1 Tax=Fopius arisanus TaxID=64838 RepID=A0A9R1TPM5_9HYME|nr:PREDICTED: uncharacterized protein LOC105272894 [Fopius arisanus]
MANFCHRDLVAVMVQVHGEGPTEDMVLCSAYLPHDSAELPPTRELQELVRLAHRCVNWRVDQEDSLSDHRCIRFEIQGTAEIAQGFVRRNPKATDWDSFRRELEERLEVGRMKPSNIERLEDEVERIHRALTESFHQACPIRPWQESAWRTFCEELEALPQVARLRRVFSAGHAQGLGGIILPGGVAITQPDEILEHLIQVHFPDSVMQGEGMCSGVEWARLGEGRPIWGLASKIVTLDRLRWAVDSFEMYKSPGPDGIYTAFLRKGGPLLLHRLLPALRACLALGHVPGRWREVRVVFIPKPGKCTYDNAKAYRPISLSSFLLKTLERLVDRHIKEGVLTMNPISPSQHAYQAGRSTETALHSLVAKIERARERKEDTLAVFIDIEGAFDNTSFGTMEMAAASFGIEIPIIRWIAAMLRILGFSNEVKHLGVWLDRRLSWKKHITMQTNKVIMTYWACRRMFGNTWGLRPRIVKWIYTAIMLPQLAYAAVVWWTAMNKACHRKTVDRTGRLAMLGITGVLRTTPTSALEALLFLQPPHLHIKEVALISAARLRLQGRWREASSGHAAMLTADSDLRGLLSWGGDACGRRWHFQKSFKVNLGYGANQLGSDRKWTPPKGLVWSTDGSRIGNRAGAGIWSEGPSIARALGLDPHTTVLQAELAALKACAREILGRGDRGKKIYICSDSRRALRARLKNESCSRFVNDCTELMERVASRNQLEVVWTPGHAGILGNMEADELAKRRCLEVAPTEQNLVGVHIDFVKDMTWKRAERGVVERWRSGEGAKHTRTPFREPTKQLAETLEGLNRMKLRSLIRLITGHWPLASYLAKIGRGSDPTCPKCGLADENPHHLGTRCSGLDEIRWDVFGTTCIKDMYVDRDGIEGLYEFARRANILAPID